MADPKPLLPVYLAVGEDQLKREAVLKRIRTRVSAMGDIDFNSEIFDADNAKASDVIASANTLPFASEKRLVVVKNLEKFNKASLESLTDYVANPSETTVLILLVAKLAKNTRLYKAIAKIGKEAVIDAGEKSKREMPTRIRDMAVSKGVAMAPDAADALLEAVGTSTLRIDTELDKIISYLPDNVKQITKADVENLVATTALIKPWDLQDAFAKRDAVGVQGLLERLYADNQSPHGLLAMCLTRLRELLSIKALQDRGAQSPEIASTLGWPDWRVRNIAGWASKWSSQELVCTLQTAADLDARIKSGADPEIEFQVWVLSSVKMK